MVQSRPPGSRHPIGSLQTPRRRGPDMLAPPGVLIGAMAATPDSYRGPRTPHTLSEAPRWCPRPPRIATGPTRRHDEPVQPPHLPARMRPVRVRTEADEGCARRLGVPARQEVSAPAPAWRPEPGVNAPPTSTPGPTPPVELARLSRPRPHIQQKSRYFLSAVPAWCSRPPRRDSARHSVGCRCGLGEFVASACALGLRHSPTSTDRLQPSVRRQSLGRKQQACECQRPGLAWPGLANKLWPSTVSRRGPCPRSGSSGPGRLRRPRRWGRCGVSRR